jgi:hypothetical protein
VAAVIATIIGFCKIAMRNGSSKFFRQVGITQSLIECEQKNYPRKWFIESVMKTIIDIEEKKYWKYFIISIYKNLSEFQELCNQNP